MNRKLILTKEEHIFMDIIGGKKFVLYDKEKGRVAMINVVKRDGEIAEFDWKKIGEAISKAFNATEKLYNEDIINLLILRVTSDFQAKIKDNLIHVEDIQDSVEHVLEQTGYTEVAKAYILYHKNRE